MHSKGRVSLADLASRATPDLDPAPPPPPRFSDASFSNYRPTHPSQETAVTLLSELVDSLGNARQPRRLFRLRSARPAQGRGLYLDGGFGVGKTHLLAAAFHAADVEEKAFLSFQELVYRTGVRGTANTASDFHGLRLLCLDEFELDDPGNTLIVKSVLQVLFDQGTAVVTTSNTPAAAQGEGRFNAEDFRREIQGIAARFTQLRLDGPDWRMRHGAGRPTRFNADLSHVPAGPAPVAEVSWNELLTVLRSLHPAAFTSLLTGTGSVRINGIGTLASQADALRFVHFIDRLYDLGIPLQFSLQPHLHADLQELFDPAWRNSAYQKKHQRCLSRLTELHRESVSQAEPVSAD